MWQEVCFDRINRIAGLTEFSQTGPAGLHPNPAILESCESCPNQRGGKMKLEVVCGRRSVLTGLTGLTGWLD
jgi:hypothetical protein